MARYQLSEIIDNCRKEALNFGDNWGLEVDRRLSEQTGPVEILYKAISLLDSGKHEAADRLLERWGPRIDGDSNLYHFRAILHQNKGDYEMARRIYEEARLRDPKNTELAQTFFRFLLEAGEERSALAVISDVIEIEHNPLDYLNRGALKINWPS